MLSKMVAKIRKVNRGKWNMLSTGEKALKILFTVMKIAFVVAFGIAALVVIAAFWIAFGLMGGMKDAVNDEIRRSKVKYYGPY